MTEGVELVRGIGNGADDFSHLPVALGAFVCPHVADGSRPACQINVADGDVTAVCENASCFDENPVLTSLYRVLHFAPDVGALGPARDGWSFARTDADAPWMAWPPDVTEPVPFRRSYDA